MPPRPEPIHVMLTLPIYHYNGVVSLCIQTGGDKVLYTRLTVPSSSRFLKKYTLLAGMWLSDVKPTMSLFLRPVIDAINTLYTKGNLRFCIFIGVQTCLYADTTGEGALSH